MSGNIVQTLDKNMRGRPRSKALDMVRSLEKPSGYSSRQSLYNALGRYEITVVAAKLGLLGDDYRDIRTKKRMMTKLSVIGQWIGKDDFFSSDAGKEWVRNNWAGIVEMSARDLVAFVRKVKAQQ